MKPATLPTRTLLQGKPWVPSEATDIRTTWRAFGWKPKQESAPRGTSQTHAREGSTV